jgi:hypothetical protein
MGSMRDACWFILAMLVACASAAPSAAQSVPRPFPTPGGPPLAQTAPPQPAPGVAQPGTATPSLQTPDEQVLGVPVYPGSQFIASFDAGRGQRYYLFGANARFLDLVAYYRTVLKTRGELVYEEPPVHMFDTGRFREETMAFPPSVTIKDYTWGGSPGYLVPRPGGASQRFPSIIQVVPVPPADRR